MTGNAQIQSPGQWMETVIKDFINQSRENTMQNAENEKAWGDPLVGFSRGMIPSTRIQGARGAFSLDPSGDFHPDVSGYESGGGGFDRHQLCPAPHGKDEN